MTKHQTVDNERESNSIDGQTVVVDNQQKDEKKHVSGSINTSDKITTKNSVDASYDSTINSSASSKNITETTGGLHPFVHWAQSQTHISLMVNLIQVENLDVSIEKGLLLKFSARGKGAHGLRDYFFTLDFYSDVDNKFDCHAIERYVLILIKKAQQKSINWPRLTKTATRLPWLRVDFDRYAGSDDDSDACEDDSVDEGKRNNDEVIDKNNKDYLKLIEELKREEASQSCESETKQTPGQTDSTNWAKKLDQIFADSSKNNPDIFNPFNKRTNKDKNLTNMKYDYRKDEVITDNSKNTAKQALDMKKTYLFLYNLVMFIMFLKVCIVLLIKGLSGTIDDDIVAGTAFIVKMLTYTQLLETIHPMIGLVPGGPLMPFTQVIGRIIVNIFLADSTIRQNAYPYAHYLFIVWSSIEVFRYSFYALRVFKVNIFALTWCRYSLFLPLYPMGGFCESMVLLSTINRYGKTGTYSFRLPNSANISFDLPLMLKIYIFFILGPTIIHLMRYMWSQRCKQFKEKVA